MAKVSPQSVVQWIFNQLLQYVSFESFVDTVIKIADMVFDKLTSFLRTKIDEQADRLRDLATKYDPESPEMEAEKEVSFQSVVEAAVLEFSGSPTYVNRGLVGGLVKFLVYQKNHPTDPLSAEADKHGLFNKYDSQDIHRAVEWMSKGFVNSR